MAGLTIDGFQIKTLAEVREEINESLRGRFGPSINLGDESILGQIVGIVAERVALLWELAEVVNSSQDTDKAMGAALEALCSLTGTFRPGATFSTVDLILGGDSGTPMIASGQQVQTTSTGVGFVTTADANFVAAPAWTQTTSYNIGDRVEHDNTLFQCATSGLSGTVAPIFVVGDPDYDPDDIVDGTVRWVYLGIGDATADVPARAMATGTVVAHARDLTTIVTNIAGWNSVVNLLDADVGREVATDAELRLLREQELATGGSSPINALRAEVLAVPDVDAVTIFVNNTDTVDADGIPPHAIEVMVRGPDNPTAEFDQSIFDALLDGVAAGIKTHGTVSGFATDDEGTQHAMKFTRPDNIEIYVDISVTVNPSEFPPNGVTQIQNAIVEWGRLQNTGKDAVSSAISAQAFKVPGVLDVSACLIDVAPGPSSSATIPISLRELAVYDTSRINVTVTNGVP